MAASETGPQPAAVEVCPLKRKSEDVGWDYGVLVDPTNPNRVKCKFCDHVSTGGIYRLKQHVAHVGKSVIKCKNSTVEAKEKCKKSLDEASRKRREKTARELNLREEVNVSRVSGEEDEVTCVGSSEPHKLGPIDKWTRPIDPKSTQAEALKQQKLLFLAIMMCRPGHKRRGKELRNNGTTGQSQTRHCMIPNSCILSKADVKIKEIHHFTQDDLMTKDVFILDCQSDIFVWDLGLARMWMPK